MMDGLDFSALTDDQLVGLIRAAIDEALTRNPAVARAAEDCMLDAAERARIAAEASAAEAAALRARERERVANEARAKVREEEAQRNAAAIRQRQAAEAQRAAEAAIRREEAAKSWLARAAALVDKPPSGIIMVYAQTGYGRRVLINEGNNRYDREHLVDYDAAALNISTTRALVRRKAELIRFCAEAASQLPLDTVYSGDEFHWGA